MNFWFGKRISIVDKVINQAPDAGCIEGSEACRSGIKFLSFAM